MDCRVVLRKKKQNSKKMYTNQMPTEEANQIP